MNKGHNYVVMTRPEGKNNLARKERFKMEIVIKQRKKLKNINIFLYIFYCFLWNLLITDHREKTYLINWRFLDKEHPSQS